MRYRKRFIDSTNIYVIEEVRENGRVRQVDFLQPDYIAWLAEGNAPEVVPYEAPPPVEPPSLEDVKAGKRAELMRRRDEILAEGFVYGGNVYPLSDDVKLKMMIQLQGLQIANMAADTYRWKDINDVYREIGDAEGFQAFCAAAMAYGLGLYAREETLQGIVNSMETSEEVLAVEWDTPVV
jgi:hypothetical protein